MSTQLGQIAKKAKLDRQVRFTSVAHLLTPAFLKETWRMMNRKAASGIDGESTEQFASEMEERVEEICKQLKAGTYRAPPVRGSKYPKVRARAARDRWGYPLWRTGCCSERLRAYSRLCLKPISLTAVLAFGRVVTLITPCRPCVCRS
jgi:hypothetical protein